MTSSNDGDFLRALFYFLFWGHSWRATIWTKEVSFQGYIYMCSLNYKLLVDKNFENHYHANVRELIQDL